MIPLFFLLFPSLFYVASYAFVFSENKVHRVDLTNATSVTFHNESIVLLHNYGSSILLGARNSVYNVSLTNDTFLPIRKIPWFPTKDAINNCQKISPELCHNDIRAFYPTARGYVLCGTYALKPKCGEFEGGQLMRIFSGVGLVPLLGDKRSSFVYQNDSIFTATVTDFSATDPLLLRRKRDDVLRTPRQGAAFDDPVFVKMYSNGNEIFLWYTEIPTDSEVCGLRRESRVSRVCAGDRGGPRPYENEWSSFVKAKVECAIHEEDQDSLYFNQLTDIFPGEKSSQVFGVFRSQFAGLGVSAICVFDKADIDQNLNSKFENVPRLSCPYSNTTEKLSELRSNPTTVKKLQTSPFFTYNGKDRFTAIAVEENVVDLSGTKYDVFFVGTNHGNVFKIIHNKTSGERKQIAEFSITNSSINHLFVHKEKRPNGNFKWRLVMLTDSSVLRVDAAPCRTASTCSQCIGLADPQCGWLTNQCVSLVEHAKAGKDRVIMQSGCLPEKTTTTTTTTTTTSSWEAVPKIAASRSNQGSRREPDFNKERETLRRRNDKSRHIGGAVGFNSAPCMCEKMEEKPCTTEVIQNEVPARAGLWPYIFFLVLGMLMGGSINYFCTWWFNRIPMKKPPTPIDVRRIDAFAAVPPSSSMYSQRSQLTSSTMVSSATGTLPLSKHTYC